MYLKAAVGAAPLQDMAGVQVSANFLYSLVNSIHRARENKYVSVT